MSIASQKWEAWIETGDKKLRFHGQVASPPRNGRRGLKPPPDKLSASRRACIASQKWEAWIETGDASRGVVCAATHRLPEMGGVD